MHRYILFISTILFFATSRRNTTEVESLHLSSLQSIADTTKEPKMVLEETTIKPMTVLSIKDTAATMNDIGPTLGKNYGTIGAFMKKKNLQMAAAPMAWYLSNSGPYYIIAGVSVNSDPGAGEGKVYVTKVKESKGIVVHYWGPYEQASKAYAKIEEWLKKNKKEKDGAPFEVYVSDPGLVKDPYQVQTDIFQPIK